MQSLNIFSNSLIWAIQKQCSRLLYDLSTADIYLILDSTQKQRWTWVARRERNVHFLIEQMPQAAPWINYNQAHKSHKFKTENVTTAWFETNISAL